MPLTTENQTNASIFDGLDVVSGSDARLTYGGTPAAVTQRTRYDNTYVLHVCWHRDAPYCREDTRLLGNAFGQHYLAHFERFTIVDGESAQAELEDKLRQLTRRARIGYNLLILFYTGSSDVDEGQFVMKRQVTPTESPNVIGDIYSCHASSDSACYVKWKPLLQILQQQPSDVLIFFDCMYVSTDCSQPITGHIEILATPKDLSDSDSSPSYSLAQRLEETLRTFDGASVAVASLADHLETLGSMIRPHHEVLSARSTGISITLPASKAHRTTERSGLLKLKLHANETLPDLAQSKLEINDWLQNTLSRGATVSSHRRIGSQNAEIPFRAAESVALDVAKWQDMVQKMPAVISHAELELDQPDEDSVKQPVSSAAILNNLVDNLQLNDAIRRVLPNKYARVCVVPLMWQNIEKHLQQEEDLNEIRAVFHDVYKYDVDEIYRIKSDRYALTALKAYINQKLNDNQGTDKLLIIVYGGHGKDPKMTTRTPYKMILTDTMAGRYELDWSLVRADLYQAHCDTLSIMNCCYAGNATLSEVNGTNETLSAVNRDTEALTLDRSFLKFLSKELRAAAETGGTNISSLYQALDRHNMPDEDAIKAPWRHRNPIDKPSIRLRPLPTSQSPRVDIAETGDESFYVQFFLRNLEDIDLGHYNEFFKNWDAPPTVKAIRFYKKDQLQKAPEAEP